MICPRCGKETDTITFRLGKRGGRINVNCVRCGYSITLKDILKAKIEEFFLGVL